MADYRPDPDAAGLAAVRRDALLAVPAERRDDLVALWSELASADAAAHVIDRLTAGGVASAPGFALVVRERGAGAVRVVVRGSFAVRIDGETVSGSGVSTWVERAFESASTVAVEVPGAVGSADAAESMLPIVEGVVAASVIAWNVGEEVPVAEPLRAAAPPAAPEPAPHPQEETIAPVEDTVVGFSRTERPRIGSGESGNGTTATTATTATIVPPAELTGAAVLGDHDGLTVAASDVRRLREARRAPSAPGTDGARTDDRLALRMPDGSFEPITGELLLGRAPAIGRVAGPRVPRPVVIGAGDPDISRTHLRVATEGGTAVVTDLESRNGTHVVAPGQPPMRLRPAEPTPVLPETVIDLGGGWTVQVVMR